MNMPFEINCQHNFSAKFRYKIWPRNSLLTGQVNLARGALFLFVFIGEKEVEKIWK